MTQQPSYPTQALNNLIDFSNSCLPYPRYGLHHMTGILKGLTATFLKEVKLAVQTLSEAEIRDYARWIDKRTYKFNCIVYDVYYDSITETYRVLDVCPEEAWALLKDTNPELKDFKHELCFKTIFLQNKIVKYLDEKVWELHPMLEEGRYEE